MARTNPIFTNWTSGELSRLIEGRVDVGKYFNGAQIAENVLISQYGGAERRPGTKFVAEVDTSSEKVRLIPFQFSTTDTYIIELGDQYMRFYRNGSSIVESEKTITGATQASPVVITSASHGYSNGDEILISDVVGMTELNGKRYLVANKTTNTFELQDKDGNSVDGTSFTAYTSGGTAERVYEISTPYLEADLFEIQFAQSADVMYIVHNDYAPRKLSRTGHTSWTLTTVTFAWPPFQPQNTTATTINPSATTGSITLAASASLFTSDMVGGYIKIHGGYVEITGFTDDQNISGTVIETLSASTATADWSFSSFSDEWGYPASVTFHEQRLFLGGTPTEPQTIWGSKLQEFENYDEDDATDDDAVVYQIATDDVNAIRWLSSGRVLGIGTAGGVFNLNTSSNFEALTPSNANVRRETTYGAQLLIPKRIGNFIYYMQRNSRTLREYSYSFEVDSFVALDMTLLSEHVTESLITDIGYAQSPNNILYLVRTDGQLATMTRQIDQKVVAWTRQKIGGSFSSGAAVVESVAVIPNGAEDQIWIVVKRTINSITRRYVEYFSAMDYGTDQEDAFFVDSGLTYDGAAATTITGLDHLEGETVDILADGAVHPQKVVTNGAVTLEYSASKVHIGLNYKSKLKTVRLEGGAQLGTAQGKKKRINRLQVRLYKSLGLKYAHEDPDVDSTVTLDEVSFRDPTMAMDSPPDLFTGDKDIQLGSGWTTDGTIYLQQDLPLPMNVLAIMPEAEVGEI